MFDMSWGEVMVIGALALIVIGPKDLPKALRTIGQVTGKIRRMAAEFQGQFQDAIREAELDDVKRQIQGVNESVSSFNPVQTIRDEIKGTVEASADKPMTPAQALPELGLQLPPMPPVPDPVLTISDAGEPVTSAAPADENKDEGERKNSAGSPSESAA